LFSARSICIEGRFMPLMQVGANPGKVKIDEFLKRQRRVPYDNIGKE